MRRFAFAAIACFLCAGFEAEGQVWTNEDDYEIGRTAKAAERKAPEWKAPEATAEDYADSERYWDAQKEKLDRLDVDLKFVNGREILVPRHGGKKKPAASKDRVGIPAFGRPVEAVAVKPDGTIIVFFRSRP